jgi:hypothetical protein
MSRDASQQQQRSKVNEDEVIGTTRLRTIKKVKKSTLNKNAGN